MPNILYYKGYTQYPNIGDQLINRSLLDYFRKHSKVRLSDGPMPSSYTVELAVTAAERTSTQPGGFHTQLVLAALRSLFRRDSQVYFLASPPGDQTTQSFATGCKYLVTGGFYLLLWLLRVELIKIGFSIGPLGWMAQVGERFRALFVKHYYVRDSISLVYAQHIGIRHAQLFPDLCWSYSPKAGSTPDSGIVAKPKIMLSFREAVHSDSQSATYKEQLLSILQAFIQKHKAAYEFEVVYQVASDAEFSRAIYASTKDLAKVSFLDRQLDLEQASYYHTAVAVLSNRLHVALLAAKFACLPILVTDIKKHVKIQGIFCDAQLEHLLVDSLGERDGAVEQIAFLLSTRAEHLQQLEVSERAYVVQSEEIMKRIFSK